MVAKLSYPVIAFHRNGHFSFITSLDDLQTCSPTSWRRGYYNELQGFDSNCNAWRVVDAQLDRSSPLVWLKLLSPVSVNLKINLEIESEGGSSIEVIRDRVLADIDNHWDFWNEEFDLDELKSRVRLLKSFEELRSLFAKK